MSSSTAKRPGFLRRLARRFRREECGAILVEMTLITPLMIALSAGVFEFGTIFYRKLLIEAGLRDAARFMARCTDGFAAIAPDCTTTAQNIAKYGSPTGGTLRVADWTTTISITTYATANNVDSATGLQDYRGTGANVTTVRVTTSYTYGATSLLAYIGLGPITFTASQEERFIGY